MTSELSEKTYLPPVENALLGNLGGYVLCTVPELHGWQKEDNTAGHIASYPPQNVGTATTGRAQ